MRVIAQFSGSVVMSGGIQNPRHILSSKSVVRPSIIMHSIKVSLATKRTQFPYILFSAESSCSQ